MKKGSLLLAFFLSLPNLGLAADAEYNKNQKPYDAIGASAAYEAGFTGAGVTVAVVDNGVLTTHQEFDGQISPLQKTEYNVPTSIKDHGTPVAGIIAAKKDGVEMHGIAYDSKILSFSAYLIGNEGCIGCYETYEAWQILATDEFDSVKIVNNSFASLEFLPNSDSYISHKVDVLNALVAKDKLIVAGAGNETNLSPANSPAGLPYFSNTVKNNVISAIAYNPNYTPSSPYFLEGYTNLAKYAQSWSLAAPVGTIYTPSETDNTSYVDNFAGTSAATPVISGAAAVVSSAFPYMGGKQLADVLFSTAKKNYAAFSNYMVQKDDSKNQFLFFGNSDGYGQEWSSDDKDAIVRNELGGDTSCSSESVVCVDVSYADVFGQGLLNLENAVKGPGYFDIGRLSNADFWDSQYWYTVDTKGYDSVWSNDIGQVQADAATEEANVGLVKKGAGTLTLSGENTFKGKSIVEGGSLKLRGKITGDVAVNGGTFVMDSSTANLKGGLTVNSSGTALLNNGFLMSSVRNNGIVRAVKGSVTGTVTNNAFFYLSGAESEGEITAGNFNVTGGMLNNNTFEIQEGGLFKGSVNNYAVFNVSGEGTVSGSVRNQLTGKINVYDGITLNVTSEFINNGYLGGKGTIAGTVTNNEDGVIETSLSLDTLESEGKIAVVMDGQNVHPLQVNTLKITGGSFTVSKLSKEYENGGIYTVINFDYLERFENFSSSSKLTGYITAEALERSGSIDMQVSYQDLSSEVYSPGLSSEERKAAKAIDNMFRNGGQAGTKGFYFFDSNGLKKELGNMYNQIKPVRFASLPLSDKLTRGVRTHIFERQNLQDPLLYEGKKEYYSPSSRSNPPRGDVYRNYRPDNAPQQRMYRYQMPPSNDVYRNYRPGAGNVPQQNQRFYTPKKNDVYKAFRPNGRSGGQPHRMPRQVWGQMVYHQGKIDGSNDAPDSDVSGIGVMFGWDFIYSKDFLWGLTVGYAQSSLDQDAGSVDMTDWRFGAYFSRQTNFLSVDGVLTVGMQNYDKKREMTLPFERLTSKASYGGKSVEAALNVGYDIQQVPMQAGDWSFRPYIGLSVIQMSQDAYKEKGVSALNLSVDATKDTSVTLSPGLIAGFIPAEMSIFLFQPEYVFFDFRYDQTLSGGTSKTKAYFSMDTLQTAFDSPSDKEKSAFSVGIGVNGRLSEATRLNLLVNKRKGSCSDINTISVSVIHSF